MKTYITPELIVTNRTEPDILTLSCGTSGTGGDWDWSEYDNVILK